MTLEAIDCSLRKCHEYLWKITKSLAISIKLEIFFILFGIKGGGKRDLYEGESRRRNNEDDGFLFINGIIPSKTLI